MTNKYVPQNTRTYFARLQKSRFLLAGVYCKSRDVSDNADS